MLLASLFRPVEAVVLESELRLAMCRIESFRVVAAHMCVASLS